jgi:RimJ/RimL family protein N-acetyltransferase
MIYGERIRLRAAERSDLPMFVKWLNDPDVSRHLGLHLPLSLASEEGWFESMLKGTPEEQVLVIEKKQADESWLPLGNCSLMDINWRNRYAEFGIFIGEKEFWNQGFGAEAARLILKHGFATLNLHRIWLRVNANNPRAIKAYEKAGYVREGIQRQAMFQDGQYLDVIVMSVLRPEWEAQMD